MAAHLSEQKVVELKDAFALLDKNNDGFLNHSEVKDIVMSLNNTANERVVETIIRSVDTDGDGKINFVEFLNMIADKFTNDEEPEGTELEQIFRIFDRDGDNYITHVEMKRALDELGDKVPDSEIEEMIREADTDNDGKLTFEEFKAIMLKKEQGLCA